MTITIWIEDEALNFRGKTDVKSFESALEEFGKLQRRYEKIASLPKEESDF